MNKKVKKFILLLMVIIIISLINGYIFKIDDMDLALTIWFIAPPIVGLTAAFIALKIEYSYRIIKFDNNYNYFRDLIKKYNPSILSLIYKSVYYPRLSMVGLLQLEKKRRL